MKTLTIISEVFIKKDGTETVDRSFNVIVNEYSKHFERINIIGPGEEDFEFIQGMNPKVFYTSTTIYSKHLKKRIKYQLQNSRAKSFFKNVIKRGGTDIVQIRIPSIFSMMAYSVVKDLSLTLTSYVAGEWQSSFVANHNFLGSSFVGRFLDQRQKKIIKNSIAVSAGPEIGEIYKRLNKIYPYFSTTHINTYEIKKNNNILELLFVGRLEGIKRVEDGILALKKLSEQGIKARFHIVGDGVYIKSIRKLIEDKKLSDKVILYGHISDTVELEKLYKKADIFIFPSISEGTPKVLAESMSYGVIPVAVRDTGSIKYIIEDGENGFLVDAYSPDQIAFKVKSIAFSKETQEYMQEKCYEYAKEHSIIKEVDNMWKYIFNEIEKK